jgi:hypothetical protein
MTWVKPVDVLLIGWCRRIKWRCQTNWAGKCHSIAVRAITEKANRISRVVEMAVLVVWSEPLSAECSFSLICW